MGRQGSPPPIWPCGCQFPSWSGNQNCPLFGCGGSADPWSTEGLATFRKAGSGRAMQRLLCEDVVSFHVLANLKWLNFNSLNFCYTKMRVLIDRKQQQALLPGKMRYFSTYRLVQSTGLVSVTAATLVSSRGEIRQPKHHGHPLLFGEQDYVLMTSCR